MAQTETLREFLVKLGFKVDDKSHKQFESSVAGATKRVGALATAVYAAAGTVTAGVAAMAHRLDDLYFASQRTGASAKNLKAFGYAAEQLGSSGQAAVAVVESLAQKMRHSPGFENLIQGLGVNTRGKNGQLRDTVSILGDIGKKLRAMPMYQAEAFASRLGIDEKTMLAMRSGQMGKYMTQFGQMAGGTNFDSATKGAHEMMTTMRQLGAQFGILGVQVEDSVGKKVGPQMKQLAKWMRENGPEIANDFALAANSIVIAAGWMTNAFKTVFGWAEKAFKAIEKFSAKHIAPTKGGHMLGTATAHILAGLGDPNAQQALENTQKGVTGVMFTPKTMPKIRQAMKYFMGQGWSRAQASGIVANLMRESGLNSGAVGDSGKAYGIAQWHPARQKAFEKWSGHSIKNATMQEQLAFVQHELKSKEFSKAAYALNKAKNNAKAAGGAFSLYYERPAAAQDEAHRRAVMAERIEARADIHVHGVQDPQAVANKVRDAQDQVNHTLIRNMRSPAQ